MLLKVIIDQSFWRPLLIAYTFLLMSVAQKKNMKQIEQRFKVAEPPRHRRRLDHHHHHLSPYRYHLLVTCTSMVRTANTVQYIQ